jgi:hypothetical protein
MKPSAPSAADRFDRAAKLLTKDQSLPDWLIPALAHYSPLVGGRRSTPDDDRDDHELLKAARYLERWLPTYTIAADEYGLILPDEVETVVMALPEVIEYLETQCREPRKGGPIPDSRAYVCAAVCAYAWRRLCDEVNPYSPNLLQACEEYWKACGNPEKVTSDGNESNWQRYLVAVKREDDRAFREGFNRFIDATTT